ncbi:hypothetical protein Mjas_03545 [Methanothermococcus sp. Ax23]|uniref:hypothetical protein n=1 Tax=Methanothermococcus sp. Ax23 TaxID=3156486 RepID=UPI003BA08E73
MFWEEFDVLKDLNFLEELTNLNVKLIKYLLQYIFEDDNSYYDFLNRNLGSHKDPADALINRLTLIIIAHTKYYNIYIKKYSEKNYKKIACTIPNKINVWEFINIASQSRNNDLHLERMWLDNGYVHLPNKMASNGKTIKETYAIELLRVKLKEMVERIRLHELPKEVKNNEKIKEIINFIGSIVKFEGVEGIKISGFKGDIPKEWHPPCIRGILDDILSGGSPSHYARRSFVVYWFCAKFNPNLRPIENGELVNIGALDIAKDDEIENFLNEVVSIFNTVGDFDVDRTKYYISHNIGYKVATHITHCEYCKNWKEDGGKGLSYYCKPDSICRMRNENGKPKIIHPLDYLCYNINKHQNKKEIIKEKEKDK